MFINRNVKIFIHTLSFYRIEDGHMANKFQYTKMKTRIILQYVHRKFNLDCALDTL